MNELNQMTDWLFEANLEAFCRILANVAGDEGYANEDGLAISTGLATTHSETERWYGFDFAGDPPIRLEIAREVGAGVVAVRVTGDAERLSALRLAVSICQEFRVISRNVL